MARMRGRHRLVAIALTLLWSGNALANATRLGGGGGLDLSLTRIVISLLLCLGIAVSVILLIRRSGGRANLGALRTLLARDLPAEQRIRVLESRRISAHADVCLVRCDQVEYLILCSPQQQQLLREQPTARDTET